MSRFETIYNFKVLDEIGQGNTVFVINKTEYEKPTAIRIANEMCVSDLMSIINYDNNDNRFDFYKIIESEDNTK